MPNGFLGNVKILDEDQVDQLLAELDKVMDPSHPGNNLFYDFFLNECLADGVTLLFTSDWQLSPSYTDTGLDPETTYGYTVQARDRSVNLNTNTVSSPAAEATTLPTVWPSPTAKRISN